MGRGQKIVVFVLFFLLFLLIGFYYSLKKNIVKYRTAFYVYFVSANEEFKLIPVERITRPLLGIEEKVRFSIESLLSGPTEEEKKRNIITMIPESVKLLNCRIEDDVVFLDFSEDIEKGGGAEEMKTRLAQVVFTATQFPEIKKVRFMIEGKFIKYFSGEGITDVEKPLGRKDFIEFQYGGENEKRNPS